MALAAFVRPLSDVLDRVRDGLDRFLGKRVALPVVLTGVVLVLVFNEGTYRDQYGAMKTGVVFTDARMAAGRVLESLNEAESAQRGFLLTGKREYLDRYPAAIDRAQSGLRQTLELLQDVTIEGHANAAKVDLAMSEKLGEMAVSIELAKSGRRDEALTVISSDVGQHRMQLIRDTLGKALADAAVIQGERRRSLFDNLEWRRWIIHLLAMLVAGGVLHSMRQQRQQVRERELQKELLEAQVDERTRELRQLATHLQTLSEDQRAHLARELHDELGGLLTAVKLDHTRIKAVAADNPKLLERLAAASKRVDELITLKRRIIEDLRPSALDHLGLSRSLEILCQEVSERLGLPVETAFDEILLAPDAQLAVYRLVQEALTNVQKYARPTQVSVHAVSSGGEAWIEVSDDGLGFDMHAVGVGRHGLAGMRYRVESLGGRMAIRSAPGEGTTLSARFPLSADQPVKG